MRPQSELFHVKIKQSQVLAEKLGNSPNEQAAQSSYVEMKCQVIAMQLQLRHLF